MVSPVKPPGIKERDKGNIYYKDGESKMVAFTLLKSQSKQLLEPRIEGEAFDSNAEFK